MILIPSLNVFAYEWLEMMKNKSEFECVIFLFNNFHNKFLKQNYRSILCQRF